MKTYPLQSISLTEAMQLQFRLVDEITKVFTGTEILTLGDLGVVPGLNKPKTTKKVEEVIANFFDAEAAILVRGAGTGAIRQALFSMMKPGDLLLVHAAPIYNTTKTTLEMMGIETIVADFNDLADIKEVLHSNPNIKCALVQYTRQKIDDSYEFGAVIEAIKEYSNIPIITDDNYAAFKVSKIGCQYGADLSTFSTFKLLGPEGIGCVVGKKEYIEIINSSQYSGGSQTQGHEALEVLRGLVYAPVALAIQAEVNEELLIRLNNGEIEAVKTAFLANAQSKVLLVEFKEEIAAQVLLEAEKLGAAPNPIGAESKYEIVPMFYRVSGTFRSSDTSLEKRMIRINPMRSGADTVIRILEEALRRIK
jgi:O-acetylhomoserine/O-acetylserine sulfhydrylase-like pyridoxal-dependent enzyme